jgi:sugar transferase (PEP-CTERM system associated)
MKVRVFGHYVAPSMLILIGVEFFVLICVFYAGYLIRWSQLGGGWILANIREAIAFALVFATTMVALGLYQRGSSRNMRETFMRLLAVCVIGFAGIVVVVYTFRSLDIWRSTLAWVVPLTPAAIMLSRFTFLNLANLHALRAKILVVGTGRSAKMIQDFEKNDETCGFTTIGFVALDGNEAKVEEKMVLRDVDSIADYAQGRGIEEVVVAVEDRRGKLPMQQLLACRSADVRVTEYSTFWERETGSVDLDAFNPSFMVFAERFVGGRLQAALKRGFDISVSIILLVLSSPVMVLTAFLVRVTSPGPVLYRQERSGRLGIPFEILKFRSMRTDAEVAGKPQWAKENDPRVTSIGKFIRKVRIDELPQIFNVLRGEMSFIGPRPERPFFVDQLAAKIPYYNERHRVKPGISGWAQLKYPYGASEDDARGKLQFDLYYVKNYSVFLDALILLQTVRVVLFRIGSR